MSNISIKKDGGFNGRGVQLFAGGRMLRPAGCCWWGRAGGPLGAGMTGVSHHVERTRFISYVKMHPKLAWGPVT